MDFSGVNQTVSAASSVAGNRSTAAQQAGDFDVFLKMLTTQAQNQDPFDPVDATEYASQLASFSAVEQQVRSNELLSELVAMASDGGFERLASWIGLETLAPGAAFFDGVPVEIGFDPLEGEDAAILVLRDAEGGVRNRITLPEGSTTYLWDGTDSSGSQLPQGIYDAEIEIYRDGALDETRAARSYMRIDEVSRSEEGLILTLRGGEALNAAAVAAVRRPGG